MDTNQTLQKALTSIQKLKSALRQQLADNPIAIVGLSCRFPMAKNKEEFWQMLASGKNSISAIPDERWQLLARTDEIALRDKGNTYSGGFIPEIDQFDAYFFGITPREATRMDPQQRILLEVSYEAIEDAGLTTERLSGSNTGVFMSLYGSQVGYLQKSVDDMDALYVPTGNAASIAANRLSYLFNLQGPSVVLDTACSSSLVALHFACLNLQNKLCDMALVGGVNINLLPSIHHVLAQAKMLSPDGQCKTFSAEANGYVPGEGVGVVVLKPLQQALKDQDRIYAVIMGSAVNQDGRTNGLTAPNGLQQEEVMRSAHQAAKIKQENISYIECHGTGTFLGDPIEIQALGNVLGKNRNEDQACLLGSVKTNIGHLEPAAGMASLIKVALSLYHQKIPAHLNYSTPNPHIELKKHHFKIPQSLTAWPKYGDYRLAGISGFGFGGTNAHLVVRELKEAEQTTIQTTEKKEEIFTLSAKDHSSLIALMKNWLDFLNQNVRLNFSALCYNLHIRRSHYDYRVAIIASSVAELIPLLAQAINHPNQLAHPIFVQSQSEKNHVNLEESNYKEMLISTLALHYAKGAAIDWRQYESERCYPHLDLPLYVWNHKSYWPVFENNKVQKKPIKKLYPLDGREMSSPLPFLQFEFRVNNKNLPEVADTFNILHAGYYLEILGFAVDQLSHQNTFTVENMTFLSPLLVPQEGQIHIQLILKKTGDEIYHFRFYSTIGDNKNWVEHAHGKLLLIALNEKNDYSIDAIKKNCTAHEMGKVLYEKIVNMGMPAGQSIRWTHQYWYNDHEILCEFQQPETMNRNEDFFIKLHPGIVDACIQPIFKLLPDRLKTPFIASNIVRIKFFGAEAGPFYLHAKLKNIYSGDEKILGSLYLLNKNAQIIAEFVDITLTQFNNRIQIEKIMQATQQNEKMQLSNFTSAERREQVMKFLREQVGVIFSMPIDDIAVDRSLRDMGIDSLMALVLMRAMEENFHVNYSMQTLLAGPTITELTDYILANYKVQHSPQINSELTARAKTPVIAYRQPLSRPEFRLFCFPYGGGGASIYRDWQQLFSDRIEICPIQLPGREERLNEKPIADANQLINHLIDHLQMELDLPFAFFGHSFGTLIGFELARHLRKRGLKQPIHLFASAFPDPRTPTKSLDNLLRQLNRININLLDIENKHSLTQLSHDQLAQLSDIFNNHGIADYGDHLMNPHIIQILLPIFMSDMSIVKTYRYEEDVPLDIPITVFSGKRDTWVSPEEHKSWVHHSRRKCEFYEFDSGHLFIKDKQIKKQVIQIISESLGRSRALVPSD